MGREMYTGKAKTGEQMNGEENHIHSPSRFAGKICEML